MLKKEIICDCCNMAIDKNNKYGRIRIDRVSLFGTIYEEMDICENCWKIIKDKIQNKKEEVKNDL